MSVPWRQLVLAALRLFRRGRPSLDFGRLLDEARRDPVSLSAEALERALHQTHPAASGITQPAA